MKITASFASMDEAENCARRLKHTCDGINAIRIRYHSADGPEIEPVAGPPAMNGPGTMDTTTNNVASAPYSAFFALELGPPKENDGSDRRRDCLMDVDADPMYRREVEAILLNEHGSRLHTQE